MLKNFFRTAIRNILKNKAYAVINFIGLTTGLALALLIISYVRSEISYDRFHEHADRLYRIGYTAPNGLELALTPPPIAPRLKDFFSEVEETARIYKRNVSISLPEQREAFEESDVCFADATIMDLFTIEFVRGTPERALHDKFTVLITEEMATKYFGDKDPLGETLIFAGKHPFKIAGVVKNFPENSHLRFSMLVPYDNMFDLESEASAKLLRDNLDINFVISHSYTYVLLKPGSDPQNVDRGMEAFLKKYALPQLQVGQIFTLMPVKDIHLKSPLLAEPTPTNSLTNLIIFIGVGMLTLVIACINYINLSTAQSFSRIKEVGIRKILGSMKYQLILQFMAESFLFASVAMGLSFLVFYSALPLLNTLTDKHLVFNELIDYKLITASGILLIFITVLAGGYPAFFITQFESVNSLKGSGMMHYGNSQWLRRVLVVFQLTIACVLLSGSLLIMKQMNYINSRPLGFQYEHVVNIPLFSEGTNGTFRVNDSIYYSQLQTFRDLVEAQTGVVSSTLSSAAPGVGMTYRNIIPEGFTQQDNLFIAHMGVDYDFFKSYDIAFAAGRSFHKDFGTDSQEAYIVNETAVKEFNWETPEKALGKTIVREGKKGHVVGVIRDFNFSSLTTAISAMVLDIEPSHFNTLSVRFDHPDVQQSIEKLEASWNQMFPEKAFEFRFLDEQLQEQYENFQNFGIVIQSFTLIAILISCLGVYGLVLFVVQRKVKEIGVRKVLGASTGNILTLIYKDFAWLLAIGFLLAVPVSYYLMNRWLENFSYHTTLDAVTYSISFILVVTVVLATISYQAVKASLANPVLSLRSE
jgi:putative ABC transport system permease protein